VTALYFDENMSRIIADALTKRGHPATMAVDVGMEGKPDEEHLAFATQQSVVMVTFDRPFAGRAQLRSDFYGLFCLDSELQNDPGRAIELLTEYAELFNPPKDTGQVFWLK
jgi:predicted nuclease of predicted toxin-antitoxin system